MVKKKEVRKKVLKNNSEKNNLFFSWKFYLIILAVIFGGILIFNFFQQPIYSPGNTVTRTFNVTETKIGNIVNVTLEIETTGATGVFIVEQLPSLSKVRIANNPLLGVVDSQRNQIVFNFTTGNLSFVPGKFNYELIFLEEETYDDFWSGTFSYFFDGSGFETPTKILGQNLVEVYSRENSVRVSVNNTSPGLMEWINVTFELNVSNKNYNEFLINQFLPNSSKIELNIPSYMVWDRIKDILNVNLNFGSSHLVPSLWSYSIRFLESGSYNLSNGNFSLGSSTLPTFYANFTNNPINFIFSCTPNYLQHNESCIINDTRIVWYEDTNCSVKRANETFDCDYNGLGIIGNVSDIKTLRIDQLKINIDERKFNETKNYSNDEYLVEFMDEDENIILSFDYDFEDDPALNLKNIYLEKQRSSSDLGYLIVDGLVDINKTFLVEKISSDSSYVCVKDKEILDIDDFSDRCAGSKEYWVRCPGNSSKFRCIVQGNFFSVSGLKNSAIKEMIDFTPIVDSDNDDDDPATTCAQRWSCSWSSCTNNVQTYDCVDLNNCNNLTGRPSESPKTCSSQTTASTTTTTNTGSSSGTTPTDKGKIIFYVLISLIILIFLIVLIIFFVQYTKKKNSISVPVRYS